MIFKSAMGKWQLLFQDGFQAPDRINFNYELHQTLDCQGCVIKKDETRQPYTNI